MAEVEAHLNSCESNLSRHAITRAAQRGVTEDSINLVLAFGDLEYSAGGRRRRLRLSRSRAAELVADGYSFRSIDAAQRVELILGTMDCIVTVIRCDSHPARRRTALPATIPQSRSKRDRTRSWKR
jgi:hypothetical protein